jgi:transposase
MLITCYDFGMSRELPAALDLKSLPNEVAPLQDLVIALAHQLENLQQQFLNLRRLHFGAKCEQLSALQADLFADTVSLPVPPTVTETVSYERTVRNGRPRLPKDLPRTRIDYELSESERAEFETVERIGEEISETLDYTPAKLIVVEHARAKYRCEKAGEATIRVAQAEPSPIPKANASAGLLAQVLVAKYADGLPLNRQEKIFKRHGVEIPRTTLCDWVLGSTELLSALMAPLQAHVVAAPVIFADDTTLDLLERGRGQTRTARMWAYVSAGETQDSEGGWHPYPKAAVFEFTETREAEYPTRFLKDYTGYLQADDYVGYHATYRSGRVTHAACWVHARRKFYDIAKHQKTPGLAHEALQFISQLYEIEAKIKHKPPDEKYRVRQAETLPLLEKFKVWLEGHFPSLLPQGPLAQAFGYVLSNWQALLRFTETGFLAPDTNLVERTIRPIAVGRKAWLFAASTRGGEAAAVAFSLLETAKLNGIEPFAYLKDVLARIRSHRIDRLTELLPFNWKPAV